MELRQLRYVVAVAEELSFTRAAARLRIAQPALSQQIQRLEAGLGVRLFERSSQRVAPTDAGLALLVRARRALAEVDAATAEIGDLAALRRGRLTIGVTPTPGPLDLSELLARFHATHPAIELDVREALSVDLGQQLRDGTLDLAFVTTRPASRADGLDARPLAAEPLVLATWPGHPLADAPHATLRDIAAGPLVGFPRGATIRGALERAATRQDLPPLRFAFAVGDAQRARALVARRLGVAVLPRSDALRPGPTVVVVPLVAPALTHEVLLATRRGRAPSPAADALLRLVATTTADDPSR